MKKRILLTGATGFLGSHLAKALLADGDEVVALKRKRVHVAVVCSSQIKLSRRHCSHKFCE